MTQHVSLSIEQWLALRQDGFDAPPIWFTVVGGSMRPLIRVGRDRVILVSVDPEEIRVGDIVLFPGHFRGGEYCLHRVYKLDGDRVQTFGDANPGRTAGFPARSSSAGCSSSGAGTKPSTATTRSGKNAESPDLAYVAAEAEKLGIADFEKATRELALRLFGGEALLQADRELLAYFLASGAYGNWDNKIQNRLTRLGYGKLRYAFERFIEPVNKKSWNYPNIVKELPFFCRHKLLLPLLMFHRLFRSLFSGRFTAEFRALKHARR